MLGAAGLQHGVTDIPGLQVVIDGLSELSSRDGLTDIVNLRLFRMVLKRELDRMVRTGGAAGAAAVRH
jgi:PleD family two-component response regulator